MLTISAECPDRSQLTANSFRPNAATPTRVLFDYSAFLIAASKSCVPPVPVYTIFPVRSTTTT